MNNLSITILVAEDHGLLRDGIAFTLEAEGFTVLVAEDGQEALDLLESNSVSLILADIAMPRVNGYQLFEAVRKNATLLGVPFVFLTARNMDSDVRFGKEMGVDDYLTKPFEADDLLATIRGKLKRARQIRQTGHRSGPSSTQRTAPITQQLEGRNVLVAGDIRLDPERHTASFRDQKLKLSKREFTVLRLLVERRNRLVSPQELVAVTHNMETDAVDASNLSRPVIRSLRRKLGFDVGETGCIETIRGIGYRLLTDSVSC